MTLCRARMPTVLHHKSYHGSHRSFTVKLLNDVLEGCWIAQAVRTTTLRLGHGREGRSRLSDLRHAARLCAAGAGSEVAWVRGQVLRMRTGPRHRTVLRQLVQYVTPYHAHKGDDINSRPR